MKKTLLRTFSFLCLLLFAGFLHAQTTQDWNFSSPSFNALGSITESVSVEGLTIHATSDKPVTVDGSNKTVDEVSYTHRIKFGGTGTFNEVGDVALNRVLSFAVQGNTTITIVGTHASSSGDPRDLVIASGNKANEVGRMIVTPGVIDKATFNYNGGPDTIFVWSSNSGINLYHLKAVTEAVATGPKKVGYFTTDNAMGVGAGPDPIFTLLNSDPNLEVTKVVGTAAVTDVSMFDMVVLQEAPGSSNPVVVSLKGCTKPILFMKSFGFNKLLATYPATNWGSAGDAFVRRLKVNEAQKGHPIFTGIDIPASNQLNIFKDWANDNGTQTDQAANRKKGLQFVYTILNPVGDILNLGSPDTATVTQVDASTILDVPAGATLNGQNIPARMIAIGYNYGAQCYNNSTNLTSEGITIIRNAVYILAGLTVPAEMVEAPEKETLADKKIIFIANPTNANDSLQIDWLTKQGAIVSKFYPSAKLSVAPTTEIDMLNEADLVIIGRSPGSTDFQAAADKAAWNNLTTPILMNSQWIARNNRLNWFNSSTVNVKSGTGNALATVQVPSDQVFSKINLVENKLDWSNLTDDFFGNVTQTNGTVLVVLDTTTTAPIFVRFSTDQEFYTGSVDKPAGVRTYFGFGDDTGGKVNFFPLTTDAQKVYWAEILRMLDLPIEEPTYLHTIKSNVATLSTLTISQGELTPAFSSGVAAYSVTLPAGVSSVVINATPTDSIATVTGTGTVELMVGQNKKEIVVTAEDGKTMKVYTIEITVEEPVFVAKKVAYVNFDKVMTGEGSAQPANDPIIKMLQLDENIDVDVMLVGNDSILDLSSYDAVIAQETFGSAVNILKPGGSLGMASIPVPFILNKAFTLKGERGFTKGTPGSGGEVEGTIYLKATPENQANPMFKGIKFVGDSVQIFKTGADDNGGDTRTKGLQYAADVVISAENTLLASGVNDPANATVCINDIPSGASIGSETLQARMIAFAMNYGAICKDGGGNMTEAGLTLWRNAVYILVGLEVPETGVSNVAVLDTLIASVGTLSPVFSPAKKAYQLNLPAGTTSVSFEATVSGGVEIVSNPGSVTLTNGIDTQVSIEVKAPIGNETVTYDIYIHVASENEILYVGTSEPVLANTKGFDKNPVKLLKEAGYSVTFVDRSAINVANYDYSPYKALVIAPGVSSSNIVYFAKEGYPIPCVVMQPDAPRSDKWGWVGTSKSNGVQMYVTKIYDAESAKLKITNNTHPITSGYSVDQLITWTLGTVDSIDWKGKELKSYNLSDSIPEAIALGTISADGKALTSMWAVPAGTSVRSPLPETGYGRTTLSNNVVFIGLFSDGLTFASDEFTTLMKNSLEWAMKANEPVTKKVAYISKVKTMAEGAATVETDPVYLMLKADENLDVTLVSITDASAAATFDQTPYDVLVIQESFGGGDAILKPSGALALAGLTKPFVYNKMYALKSDRALPSGGTAAGGETKGTYYISVDAAKQSHDLFKGFTFANDKVKLFRSGAADNGADTDTKALSYASNVVISVENTLLGLPANITATPTVSFSDVPAGAVFGGETMAARMITMGMNFGAICKADGTNLTDAGLTLWRNAVYVLAGLEVPSTLVDAPGEDPALSANANLSALSVSAGTLSPAFSADVTAYSINLPTGTTTATIAATAADGNATVAGIGAATFTAAGTTANVVVTAEDGSTKTYAITITVGLSAASFDLAGIKLYPNPASSYLNVDGLGFNSKVDVISATGKIMISKIANGNTMSIDLLNLNNGIYLIRVEKEGNILTSKFIKQ